MKVKTLVLTQNLRKKLKKPIGTLMKGPVKTNVKKIKKIVEKEKPPKLVVVGDVITGGMVKQKVNADLYIIDSHVMRKSVRPVRLNVSETFYVDNPAGTITKEAWLTIKKALSRKNSVRVIVKGEEDLLALPAAINAPENSLIAYGQPNKGVVLVRVTKKKRSKIHKIMSSMKS